MLRATVVLFLLKTKNDFLSNLLAINPFLSFSQILKTHNANTIIAVK
jgi:hypothetical protein